jgi:hypothetical protein
MLYFFAMFAAGCSGVGSSGGSSTPVATYTLLINWNANHEKAVNSAGGGYKIYYSKSSGFDVSTAAMVNVPYVSGGTAPTSKQITDLAAGTYYFKVVAYSALNPPGGTSGSLSSPSTEIAATVP